MKLLNLFKCTLNWMVSCIQLIVAQTTFFCFCYCCYKLNHILCHILFSENKIKYLFYDELLMTISRPSVTHLDTHAAHLWRISAVEDRPGLPSYHITFR